MSASCRTRDHDVWLDGQVVAGPVYCQAHVRQGPMGGGGGITTAILTDARFTVPLFTPAEVAVHLGLPETTVRTWLGLAKAPAVVTYLGGKTHPREASVPFIGLAEAFVLSAFRASGLPLQRIRPAVERLRTEVDLPHALANKRVLTDGAEILFEYGREHDDAVVKDLVVVRNQQVVFREIVESYLRCITWADDGYSGGLALPRYGAANVVVDPYRNFGQPMFAEGGTRLEDVLDLFFAGEPIEVVAHEYGVTREQVEAAVRVAGRAVAA